MMAKIRMPKAATEMVTMRPFSVKKVNSKKLRVKGMRKVAAIIPMIVRRRVARRGLRGFEIQ